jgi:uncharacterized protein YheU (UPF0270 family)
LNQNQTSSGILIPYDQLSSEALTGVIEEFVTRDGTDYGEQEVPLEEKAGRVKRQLETGTAVIVFAPDLETCTILPADHPGVRALAP